MTEMMKVIAEAEGVRTPKKKRTAADLKKIYDDHVAKKATKRKAEIAEKTSRSAKDRAKVTPKPLSAKDADKVTKVAPATVEPIKMNFISANGYVREAGYDEKSKMFHIGFAKSTWAMPSSKKEWDAFEAAVADPNINIDSYYRKAFRGRTPEMIAVRKGAK